MNKKQSTIDKVLDIVVECCTVEVDGVRQITAEDIRGKSRKDGVCMARCIFVSQLMFMGYSRSTISAYIHRDIKSIGNILASAHEFKKQSRAYRIAEAESTLMIRDLDATL